MAAAGESRMVRMACQHQRGVMLPASVSRASVAAQLRWCQSSESAPAARAAVARRTAVVTAIRLRRSADCRLEAAADRQLVQAPENSTVAGSSDSLMVGASAGCPAAVVLRFRRKAQASRQLTMSSCRARQSLTGPWGRPTRSEWQDSRRRAKRLCHCGRRRRRSGRRRRGSRRG